MTQTGQNYDAFDISDRFAFHKIWHIKKFQGGWTKKLRWGHVIEQPIELGDDRMAERTKRRSMTFRDPWTIMDLRWCIAAPLETRAMEKFRS
jgi:hypothetical protein